MTSDDRAAAEELALSMSYRDAAVFLRSQSGRTLVECAQWADHIGSAHPETVLGRSRPTQH